MTITHDALVKIAGRWLKTTVGCTVVLTELVTTAQEGDAIEKHLGDLSLGREE